MNGKCDRCKKDSNVTTGSYFNEEMICPDCRDKESKHPLYAKAKEEELKEVQKGNYNFKGIGLPDDLKEEF